jgi:hypothetical protein
MSCLFQSLSSHFREPISASAIRAAICNFLKTNPVLFDNLRVADALPEGTSLDVYVNTMRLDETWGGAIEIKAFCELFGVPVHVLHTMNGRVIEFAPSSGRRSGVVHLNFNGGHYEPR